MPNKEQKEAAEMKGTSKALQIKSPLLGRTFLAQKRKEKKGKREKKIPSSLEGIYVSEG